MDARLGADFCANADGQVGITDWRFNGWAKYPDWRRTTSFRDAWRSCWGCPVAAGGRVGNGAPHDWFLKAAPLTRTAQGILLTTEECLLSEVQQRNPGVSREQLERAFDDYLGIDRVIWLNRGIAGDDTHGHVDDISRFVGPATIVTACRAEQERCEPCAAG